MRNYRDLTPHEVERLKDEYPITANRRLAIRYGVSIDGISKLAKNLGWKKDRSSVCTGSCGGHTPTSEEEAWIVQHFPNTPNPEIMQRIDIAERTLYRIARRYGLKKDKRYLSRMRRANLKEASRKCKELGVYMENAERAKIMWQKTKVKPREEWPGYKPGLKPWQQPGMTRQQIRARQTKGRGNHEASAQDGTLPYHIRRKAADQAQSVQEHHTQSFDTQVHDDKGLQLFCDRGRSEHYMLRRADTAIHEARSNGKTVRTEGGSSRRIGRNRIKRLKND